MNTEIKTSNIQRAKMFLTKQARNIFWLFIFTMWIIIGGIVIYQLKIADASTIHIQTYRTIIEKAQERISEKQNTIDILKEDIELDSNLVECSRNQISRILDWKDYDLEYCSESFM